MLRVGVVQVGRHLLNLLNTLRGLVRQSPPCYLRRVLVRLLCNLRQFLVVPIPCDILLDCQVGPGLFFCRQAALFTEVFESRTNGGYLFILLGPRKIFLLRRLLFRFGFGSLL